MSTSNEASHVGQTKIVHGQNQRRKGVYVKLQIYKWSNEKSPLCIFTKLRLHI